MRSAGIGSLVYVSSVASSIKGVPRRSVYGATKAGLIGLAKSVAADFVTEGIRANCICPGTVDTPSLQQRIEAKGDDFDAIRSAFVARQPMGRLGTAQEIGALARFLCSPSASFITGQAIAIDGGWTI
jgi:2-keto-3-deoxy-L-fuconate dehydrogenase